MTQLIPLHSQTIDGNAVETVSARELHSFLESRQDFSTWIKNRISEYDFVEHQDFTTAPQKYGTANGGYATRNEYYVTLDMAKELSLYAPDFSGTYTTEQGKHALMIGLRNVLRNMDS